MDDGVKGRVILILSILAAVFLVLWLGTGRDLSRQKKFATDKAALSMELEEKNAKLEKEKAALKEELRIVQAELAEEKSIHEATRKTLSQEQVAEQALKVELERVTRLNEALEKDSRAVEADKKI